jgi:hypothetical protein
MRVCKEFFNVEKIIEIRELGGGHINETYEVIFKDYRYVLQQLNSVVFFSPLGVMNNIRLVTDHIKKKVVYEGKNPKRAVLTLIKTRFDQDIAIVDNEYWRCVEYIDGGVGYDLVPDAKTFYEVGRAVGNFQNLLSDFHTRLIDDPIKNFHDTPKRYENFLRVIKVDEFSRVSECEEEINYIKQRKSTLNVITSKLEDKSIPRRVTHNDTKSSNVMIDEKTGEYLCLIDFDTVMKGSLVYDYGDALRFGASTALEDETDLNKVGINFEYFEAFTEGFLLEMKPDITSGKVYEKPISKEEINLLYEGYYIITLELAMRFLEDYLMGDIYFRIKEGRPKHNLERARNQLKLVNEIEKNEKKLKDIINSCLIKLGYEEVNLIK